MASQRRPCMDDAVRAETAETFRSSYPLHPEVLATLTGKTATLGNFQRVRGMLAVVGAHNFPSLERETRRRNRNPSSSYQSRIPADPPGDCDTARTVRLRSGHKQRYCRRTDREKGLGRRYRCSEITPACRLILSMLHEPYSCIHLPLTIHSKEFRRSNFAILWSVPS